MNPFNYVKPQKNMKCFVKFSVECKEKTQPRGHKHFSRFSSAHKDCSVHITVEAARHFAFLILVVFTKVSPET